MSLATYFGFAVTPSTNEELPAIFPIEMTSDHFIETDVINIYSKILTDTAERTHGLAQKNQHLLWDNCLKSEAGDGLITMLARAMYDKADLFLVFESGVNVIRKATTDEQAQIKADYLKEAKSKTGVYISFKNYSRSDMVKLYSSLEFCTIQALNKTINLSAAIQIKIDGLRGNINLGDSANAASQALAIAKGLGNGKDVYIDAKDSIETSRPDLESTKTSIQFLNQKRSFYLGMPESYINGEQTGGIGSSGENDTKAIERGLKNYYYSILKPALEALFGGTYSYKSQDFRQIQGSLEVLKTFDITSDELISQENKLAIVNKLFDLPEDATGDEPEEIDLTAMQPGKPIIAPPKKEAAVERVN